MSYIWHQQPNMFFPEWRVGEKAFGRFRHPAWSYSNRNLGGEEGNCGRQVVGGRHVTRKSWSNRPLYCTVSRPGRKALTLAANPRRIILLRTWRSKLWNDVKEWMKRSWTIEEKKTRERRPKVRPFTPREASRGKMIFSVPLNVLFFSRTLLVRVKLSKNCVGE